MGVDGRRHGRRHGRHGRWHDGRRNAFGTADESAVRRPEARPDPDLPTRLVSLNPPDSQAGVKLPEKGEPFEIGDIGGRQQ